jgi:hypothetical protein
MTSENYKTVSYSVAIELSKSPAEVFDHLIDLSKWWPEGFEGDSLQINSEFIFKTGASHYSKNKVVEFVPTRKIIWLTTESLRKTDNFDWTGTKMIFELTPKNDGTLLTSTYKVLFLIMNMTGWSRYVILLSKTSCKLNRKFYYNYRSSKITARCF